MAASFKLEIVTPERQVYRDQVDSVTVPGIDGQLTILAHHVPLVTVLKAGELIIRKGTDERPYAVGGGFAEVQAGKLVILADTAEHIEEIDEQRAEEARQRAEQLKHELAEDHVEYAAMAAKLERDLARLHVVRKYRHRAHHAITQEGVRHEDAERDAEH